MLKRLATSSYITAARPLAVRRAPVKPACYRRWYSDKAAEQAEQAAEVKAEETATAEPQAETGSTENSEALEWKTKWEAKDKECAQFKEAYQRSVADFRNLQETTKRELQKARDFALQKFAKDLLDSVDNFDRALSVVPEEKRADRANSKELVDLYEGIKMTQDIFEKTLAKHGLVKVDPIGEKFDPNIHEATFEIPQPDKEPGTVFHVQQTGFSYNDRVLRAAKVGVVKAAE